MSADVSKATEPLPPTEVQEADNILAEAKQTRDELKTLLAEKKSLIEREEKLKAAEMLRGRVEAGIPSAKPAEETAAQYAARIMRGGK